MKSKPWVNPGSINHGLGTASLQESLVLRIRTAILHICHLVNRKLSPAGEKQGLELGSEDVLGKVLDGKERKRKLASSSRCT